MNKVILEGNLGKDPEIRCTSNGTAVANFSVATTSQWKDKDGEDKERTEWHRVVAWGKLAEECDGLRKGGLVNVEGKLQTRSWEDKAGIKKYITEVNAHSIKSKGNKEDAGPF